MAIIGTFTRTANGNFSGSLKTLTLTAKLQFAAETNKSKDNAPDYRVFLGALEVGAAWKRTAKESGREYGWSSSTIRPSRRRSTPAWSMRKTARASTCCGPAATATDRRDRTRPARNGGALALYQRSRPGRLAAAGPAPGAPSAQFVGARNPPRGGAARRGIVEMHLLLPSMSASVSRTSASRLQSVCSLIDRLLTALSWLSERLQTAT